MRKINKRKKNTQTLTCRYIEIREKNEKIMNFNKNSKKKIYDNIKYTYTVYIIISSLS